MGVLKSLPVVMNHYVNEVAWRMTVSPACFEDQCRNLAERGLRGIGLDEAEAYLLDGAGLPENSLLLTFDDGYLDNYFYALPSLYKYGHNAVCFPVADRLEAREEARAPLDAVLSGRAAVPDGVARPLRRTPQGFTVRKDIFLGRAEARAMDASGIFRIASHCRGHYGVYTGPGYRDFFRPRTQLRTFYRREEEPVWGMPDFPVKPGLRFRAFIPNPDMVEEIKRLVPQDFDAAAEFFAGQSGPADLRALLAAYKKRMGRRETDAERRERMWREIGLGKEELEAILGHKVQSLCWPWGRYCEEARQLAVDAGFKVFFIVFGGANPPGRPGAVHRFENSNRGGTWLATQARLHMSPLAAGLLALVGR
ncbi:MAG: polysaccharide deacetylase family protein [Desulfovibrio sp.]|jgi:peptidoglycan/xylan/chitin deacetylase (PgdA/CDA1 family)|nr:polysaccharide deacetylase family protein [Desulfovibrio sp.]